MAPERGHRRTTLETSYARWSMPASTSSIVRNGATYPGSDLNQAGWTRKLSGKPTITVGSVTLSAEMISTLMEGATATQRSIVDLVKRLKRHEFDLVAIGRALITNPDWPKVVASGHAENLNPFSVSALERDDLFLTRCGFPLG